MVLQPDVHRVREVGEGQLVDVETQVSAEVGQTTPIFETLRS